MILEQGATPARTSWKKKNPFGGIILFCLSCCFFGQKYIHPLNKQITYIYTVEYAKK